MFLPTSKEEKDKLKIKQFDVILVSGDTYIDSVYDGIAVIGKVLQNAGLTVGIIAQPDINIENDIKRLGEPKLFWGVSAGCVDSMVANYTALKKRKRKDDLTPGGDNNRRPDRAIITYVNLIRRYFKNTKPVIIGGIEASLRRIVHYDYWSDSLKRSVLFDSKADILVYGMGEKTILELAKKMQTQEDWHNTKGICYVSKEPNESFLELASFEELKSDKKSFVKMFKTFYTNNDPLNAKGLYQKHDSRYLIQNPPQDNLTTEELDSIYNLKFEREAHPYYAKQGKITALDTIRFSVTTHRGCYGECNFCSIAVHQGRRIISRSPKSIVNEIEAMVKHPKFKGYVSDLGGPTANMYNNTCKIQAKSGSCKNKRCAYPEICKNMDNNHNEQIRLLKNIDKIKGIKKAFIGSGVRYDLVISDKKSGYDYFEKVISDHISGQMKIAPEHVIDKVLNVMGKPSSRDLISFIDEFYRITNKIGKKQFLTYYLIAAHPGCDFKDMLSLRDFLHKKIKISPEQVQIFTPTPSTISTLMYYTGMNPETLESMFVEKKENLKQKQKEILFDQRNK